MSSTSSTMASVTCGTVGTLLAAGLPTAAGATDQDQPGRQRHRKRDGPPRILVDVVHSKENNPDDYNLNKCDYEYYNNYGYFRLFRHLRSLGFEYVTWRQGELTSELLADFDVMFLNLMHEDSPGFTPPEIAVVQAFVEGGGGLLCMGEHTNAYGSAAKVNPLLRSFGLELQWTSAFDVPEFCTEPPGWILVQHLDEEHATNKGVSNIHMMAAGTIKATESPVKDSQGNPPLPKGTAFLSKQGWEGAAGSIGPAFYGDNTPTDKTARGHFPVAGVSEFGLGRVVVVGDQNLYGDPWLGFMDNFKHAMNVFEWLSDRSREASVNAAPPLSLPMRLSRPAGLLIGMDLTGRPFAVAKEGPADYHGFFFTLSREHAISARALPMSTDVEMDAWFDMDVIVLPSPTEGLPPVALSCLRQLAWLGKTMVLLLDARDITAAGVQLLQTVVPDFTLQVNGVRVGVQGLDAAGRESTATLIRKLANQAPEVLASAGAPVAGAGEGAGSKRAKKARKKAKVALQKLAEQSGGESVAKGSKTHSPAVRLQSVSADMHVAHIAFEDHTFANVVSEWGESLLATQPEEVDVALGCHAVQSSVQAPEASKAGGEHAQMLALHAATNVVDGHPVSFSHTAEDDAAPWLLVDLLRTVLVHRVILQNRLDQHQGRLRDITIQLLDERKNVIFSSPLLNPGNILNCPIHLTLSVHRPPPAEPAKFDTRCSSGEIPGGEELPGVYARYIRVSRAPSTDPGLSEADRNVLSLGEVQAIARASHRHRPLVDAAAEPDARAYQSSDQGDTDHAPNALDGVLTTFSHTAFVDAQAWWEVDLGQVVDARVVTLLNRADGWQMRLRDLTLTLRLHAHGPVVWTSPVVNMYDRLKGPSQINVHVGGVAARFLRVSRRACVDDHGFDSHDQNVLSLVRVQVLAWLPQVPLSLSKRVDLIRVAPVTAGRQRAAKAIRLRQAKVDQRREELGFPVAQADKKVQAGQVVVMLADQIWRNGMMAPFADKRPRVSGMQSAWLEYALIDWLRAQHGGVE